MEDSIEKKIEIRRHKEIFDTLNGIKNAILLQDDSELKKIMSESKAAISNFATALDNFKSNTAQEIKVETNQDKVVVELGKLAETIVDAMNGIDKRLTLLESSKKYPSKYKIERGLNGLIDYVAIEYKK